MTSTKTTEAQKYLESYLEAEDPHRKAIRTQALRRLVQLMFKQRGPLFLGLVAVLVGTFAALLEPRLFGYAIDDAIIPKRWDHLKALSLIYLLIICSRGIASMKQGYFFEKVGQRVTQELRVMLFSQLQRLPVAVFDHHPAGRLLTRVTNDIGSLNEMFSAGFVSMICNSLLIVGILTWLLTLDLRLGLITASVFPVLIVFSVYFSKRLSQAYRDARSKLSALNSFLAENISGIRIVHLFNRQKLHLDRFDRLNDWYAQAQVGSVRIFAVFQPTITVLSGVSLALIIWYGGGKAWNGGLKIGVLATYFSFALSLFQPVREIADKWNIFLSGLASAERIFSILAWPTEFEPKETENRVQPLSGLRGHIVFENVWFAYEGEHWVLRAFSLEIRPGENVGIVGHTGTGKTTLISLLLRFYEPQRGRILVDGKDIRSFDKRALRASIGVVQQEVFLFSGTFEENVDFWSTNGSSVQKDRKEKVQAVMDFIGTGIHSPEQTLNERGSNFSVGERQIIAFARTLLKGPQLWILDEATSNLDSETERILQDKLSEVSRGKTCLLIAHRLATVRNADRIVVLNKGSLVEAGDHESLVRQDGLYARLFRYQERHFPVEVGVPPG